MLSLGAHIVFPCRGGEHLEQKHRVQQAHVVAVDLPNPADHAAVGIGVQPGRGDEDPLVAVESFIRLTFEQHNQGAGRSCGDAIVLRPCSDMAKTSPWKYSSLVGLWFSNARYSASLQCIRRAAKTLMSTRISGPAFEVAGEFGLADPAHFVL